MSILVDRNTKIITQGMTDVGARVDARQPTTYFTHNLCNCGMLP